MTSSVFPLPTQAAGVHFTVNMPEPATHLFHIQLNVAKPSQDQSFALPAWIPGSYLLREFSKHLQCLRAEQNGHSVPIQQLDKHTWQVLCTSDAPVRLCYQVYAADASVRSALLNRSRAFFNGTSLFLQAVGQEDSFHTLHVEKPEAHSDWRLATGLQAQQTAPDGFGTYRASGYDELVDCPVEMGAFELACFDAAGISHRIVVSGAAPSFDMTRLRLDTEKICTAVAQFWHGVDDAALSDYLFLLNAVDEGYGGLEHRNSTALIASRRDLPRKADALDASCKAGEGYITLLGLFSHEYFHTWNVKRLRPKEFERYDYARENYTELLWFFEGFTSYYDDLLLMRAGLLDAPGYLKLLSKTVNQVLQTPGRHLQSVAQASFDAWVKYYRQDENTPNATVSYYTKGALVALCLDLTLRNEGKGTLDAVMRTLWKQCAGGPMSETDVLCALKDVAGRSFHEEIAAWVHSTQELPLADLLAQHGVRMEAEVQPRAQQLGLRMAPATEGLFIKTVLRGSPAEHAGMVPGDEWLAVEGISGAWRLKSLEDLTLYLAPGEADITAIIARDQRLLRLRLTLAHSATEMTQTVRLQLIDETTALRWLLNQ